MMRPIEWFIPISVLLLMGCFVLVSKINSTRASSLLKEASFRKEEILIAIEGSVKKPGAYKMAKGTTIGQLLRKARPAENADLKNISLTETLEKPMTLHVPALTEIQVFVSGAVVQPVALTLPPGSRIADLKSKIELTKEADRAFLRRKKKLKDGDQIVIPKKTVEQNSPH